MLVLMLFLHIVDDYYLQGILSQLKQKDWWKKNAPEALYKYDYIVGLIMHSFSWAFMITLPFAIQQHFNLSIPYYTMFVFNVLIHGIVDDLKANQKAINLIVDQLIHIGQIIFTFHILTNF
jgi:hypothetical protein